MTTQHTITINTGDQIANLLPIGLADDAVCLAFVDWIQEENNDHSAYEYLPPLSLHNCEASQIHKEKEEFVQRYFMATDEYTDQGPENYEFQVEEVQVQLNLDPRRKPITVKGYHFYGCIEGLAVDLTPIQVWRIQRRIQNEVRILEIS